MARIPHTLAASSALVGSVVLALAFTVNSSPPIATTAPADARGRLGELVSNLNPRGVSDAFRFPTTESVWRVDDPAQNLVGIWTGTWSGNSFGRNNPGQPAPTSPVSGTWILDLQSVDFAHNTASGTLTWNGRDAFWTYEINPGGNVVATPHDFIPNRTIQFDSTNTTLTSPGLGTGPQFHLTIEGYSHAPNPSDAFYGPRFSVDVFPDSGQVVSMGVGWSAHPYNVANFDTAVSSGVASGDNSPCAPGFTISNVLLPEVTIPFLIPNKPSWHIRYGSLGLNFTTGAAPSNALCEARSNVGSLNVLGAPTALGPFVTFAHSLASVTLTTFRGSAVGSLPACNFLSLSGPRNNCLLNGPFDSNAYYAKWHTEGFTTEVNVLHLAGEPDFLRTGPLTFWVNLSSRGLSPGTKSMESITRGVEPYIHQELITYLPLITTYAIIQDPGRVSLFVTKDDVVGTGESGPGTIVTNIPRSLYYQSDTNPAVILLEPDAGNYKIVVNGVVTGDYALSVSTTRLPANVTREDVAQGSIVQGNSLIYSLRLTATSDGIVHTFNPSPVAFQPLQLVMEDIGSESTLAAVVDSMLHTRDPFPIVNTQNLLSRGSDSRTRVQLLVSNLQLLPGESASAVSAEAMDSANNVYSLAVEDVRSVPNTILSQVTVCLHENLPNGRITIRVGLHGQVTNSGTIMIQR